jgi:hypothetical protein
MKRRDSRDDIDLVDRHHTADEIGCFRHLAADHRAHRYRGRRHRTFRSSRFTMSNENKKTNSGFSESRAIPKHARYSW